MARETNFLQLSSTDICEMLAGNHPLTFLRCVMQGREDLNNALWSELNFRLDNASALLLTLNSMGLQGLDMSTEGDFLYKTTKGMTDISESVVAAIMEFARDKKLGGGILRRKGLIEMNENVKGKRKTPVKRGVKYGDSAHKAFPLDTPSRVRAAHAYIHKSWQTPAEKGVTASYSRSKFISVHRRILTRMKRLGIKHTMVDALDEATRKVESRELLLKKNSKAKKSKKSLEKIEGFVNMFEMILLDHISTVKTYVLAYGKSDEGVLESSKKILSTNGSDLSLFILDAIAEMDMDVEAVNQFSGAWDIYLKTIYGYVQAVYEEDDAAKKASGLLFVQFQEDFVTLFGMMFASVVDISLLEEKIADSVSEMKAFVRAEKDGDVDEAEKRLEAWRQKHYEMAGQLSVWAAEQQEEEEEETEEVEGIEPIQGVDGIEVEEVEDIEDIEEKVEKNGALQEPPHDRNGAQDGRGAEAGKGRRDGSGSKRQKPKTGQGNRPVGHKAYRGDCVTTRNGKCYEEHNRK